MKLLILMSCALWLAIICSCDTNIFTGCSNDYDLIVHNSLGFEIIDKDSKEILLHIRANRYHYDSIALYDNLSPSIKSENYLFIGHDGLISLDFINDDERGVYNQRIAKRFYLYFNHEDQDTIDIEYEFHKNGCKHQEISYFKIAYNDSIYFNDKVDYVPCFRFLK